MSRLIARILLAIFMIPAASVIYTATLMIYGSGVDWASPRVFVVAGAVTWLFVAVYWFLLCGKTVKWTARRWTLSGGFVVAALIAGIITGVTLNAIVGEQEAGDFLASVVAPLGWLIAVTILWRETAAERTERLRSISRTAIVCPACGYNLTGLQGTRCPECGVSYTLDELLAGQPARADDEVAG